MHVSPSSFDRVAHCYDATRALPPDAVTPIAEGIVHALREVGSAPTLLEVGIGTGRIAVPVAVAGAQLTGIDIAPAMLAQLRAKCASIPVAIAGATALPFRAQVFTGALFVHVLHLLPDARTVLSEAARIVRPGGVLLYGRTEYTDSPRRMVIGWARALATELANVDFGPLDWNAAANRTFVAHADALGARLTERPLARWTERATGRTILQGIAHRICSNTWAIPDAVMPELLNRLTPRVETLLGGLDRAVENQATFTLVTAQLPR